MCHTHTHTHTLVNKGSEYLWLEEVVIASLCVLSSVGFVGIRSCRLHSALTSAFVLLYVYISVSSISGHRGNTGPAVRAGGPPSSCLAPTPKNTCLVGYEQVRVRPWQSAGLPLASLSSSVPVCSLTILHCLSEEQRLLHAEFTVRTPKMSNLISDQTRGLPLFFFCFF